MLYGACSNLWAKRARVFFALSGCGLCALLFASLLKAERLPIKTFTVANGLLRDNVTKIRQDSHGFLWFCTAEGISRFDGYSFTNFRVDDGLPDRHVNDFLETRNGIYLIATDAGLARLNPKGIHNSKENPLFTVLIPDDPKARSISVLFEDANNQVWAGTSYGLYRLKKAGENFTFENVSLGKPMTETLPVTAIIRDKRGSIWIGTDANGLFRIMPSEQITHYTKAEGLPANSITSLLEDKEGRIWAGLRDMGGLVRLVNEPEPNRSIVEKIYTVREGLPSNWIPDLFQSSDGKFWVATTEGLCLWKGDNNSVCHTYTGQNDLCDYDIWSVTEDKDGNLWVGSRCGAKKIARYGFTTYTEDDGLRDSLVHSIFENHAGDLFVSSLSKGLTISHFNDGKFTTVRPNLSERVKDFGWGWKQTVRQDNEGAWWIPTGEGLFRFSHLKNFNELSNALPEEMKTGAKGKNIFRLFEDSRGDIWVAVIGYPSELLRWERATNTWHDYTKELGYTKKLLGGSVFLEDRAGNLWIATGSDAGESGLFRYRDGNFKFFTKEDGAPPGWTRDLLLDHAGRLWFANVNLGLLRLDDLNADKLNFVRYTTAEGLSSNGVYCVTEDEFGRIYVGSGRGLDRLNPDTGQIENFTTADGLPNSDVQVAYRDRKNALWFTTLNGLARFQPEPARQRKPPTVLITGLQVNGIAQWVSILGETSIPEFNLDSDQKQVNIAFLGLGATLGEKLRYEYRLTGGDWIQTNERTVNFANLSSGSYRFEIRAITADRIISQTPAVVSFRIATPLWQRWWFIALITTLIASAGYLVYRNRLARLLELERMRTRIATDLHDDIGANLTRISLLSEIAKQENGNGKMLSSIAEIARESVGSMNDIVWAISPEHDSLLDLTRRMRQHAEDVFTFREIDLEFNAPASDSALKLSVGVRRDLLLIFKEAVNNAARHSDCSEVSIDFMTENSVLSLQVKDNGKGIDSNIETDGQGLRSMTRRASSLGGKLKIDSHVNEGTTVKFELPLQRMSSL